MPDVRILGCRHRELVLVTQRGVLHEHRPHRSLGQRLPLSQLPPSQVQAMADVIDLDRLRRRDLLGGVIREYRLAA